MTKSSSPSEFTPRQSQIFAEIVAASDLPAGAFGMLNGPGPTVGRALVEHPDVGMVTFTGSTRAWTTARRSALSSTNVSSTTSNN